MQQSSKMPTLEEMEARLLEKVKERFEAHAACHAAAVQRAYDEAGSDDVAMPDSGEFCEDADAASHGQSWALQPASKRRRRDVCEQCNICPTHKGVERDQSAREADQQAVPHGLGHREST
jgi:hypothetical protein